MRKSVFTIFTLLAFLGVNAFGQVYHREDTLFIIETLTIPLIDGSAGDEAWELVEWQPIGQVWMPWNNDPANLGQAEGLELWEGEDDFTGNFKVLWSSETSLLYFLVEITDDVFVDGYVYNENPGQGGGYPNFDIVEIFIDEDRSGGLHVFDGTGNVGRDWGTNAENAFAYHLAANAPDDGEVQNEFHALDIAGTSWGNYRIADYAGHFPEFAMKKEGNRYIWEFSLTVHNDTYDHANQEASVVTLEAGKVMGLSMAYCDNDDPGDLRRDHFFGSVYVPLEAHNEHWKQADWFGVAKLLENPATRIPGIEPASGGSLKYHVRDGFLNMEISSGYQGQAQLRIFTPGGMEVKKENIQKNTETMTHRASLAGLPGGIYIFDLIQGTFRQSGKFGIY
jgi:hypothetical protein